MAGENWVADLWLGHSASSRLLYNLLLFYFWNLWDDIVWNNTTVQFSCSSVLNGFSFNSKAHLVAKLFFLQRYEPLNIYVRDTKLNFPITSIGTNKQPGAKAFRNKSWFVIFYMIDFPCLECSCFEYHLLSSYLGWLINKHSNYGLCAPVIWGPFIKDFFYEAPP